MITAEAIKPIESCSCPVQTAEMDFLIAQKMMYEVKTIVWPQAHEGSDGQIVENTYLMTLSELLEHFSQNIDKDVENIINIKPV